MFELTHPVELRDQDLDLVAAGGGNSGGHGGHRCGCDGGDRTNYSGFSLVNVQNNGDILSNNNVLVFD